MADSNSVQEDFFTYLSAQIPSCQIQNVYLILCDIEKFCLQRKILKDNIFKTTKLNIINQVVQTVDSNKVFRFTYKHNLKKMSAAIHTYYKFMKNYMSVAETEKYQPIIQTVKTSAEHIDYRVGSNVEYTDAEYKPKGENDSVGYCTVDSANIQRNCQSIDNSLIVMPKVVVPSSIVVEKFQEKTFANEQILIRYKELLEQFFQKGFRMDSYLEMKKFRKFYQEQYETELTVADEFIYKDIRGMTILHEGKAYLPDLMLSPEKKEKLEHYIADKLSSDCNAIYYAALFSEWEDELHGERIYSPAMLKTYLSYINHGGYVIQHSYIAKDYTVQLNPEYEVREYLKEAGEPVKVAQIFGALSHITEQKIQFVLSTQEDFIWNTTGVYFHESYFNLSNSELEWISQFIEDEIKVRLFVTGNELVEAVEVHFPDIKEMYHKLTMVGKRNAIAYKLRHRFSFNGNIISRYDGSLSMADVYANYCQKRSRFTLDELNILKKELNSKIYFDKVYANSLRISKNEFVSLDMAQFNIEATDEAIGRFCTGQYMSIKSVNDFGTFPYAGYQWNEFLLEHFVANYSQKFMLLHTGYSANLCAGAIVKRNSSFKDFNELLIDIIANINRKLDEDAALEYLCQRGYIGRRRYSDIGRILAEAKVVRSKKG